MPYRGAELLACRTAARLAVEDEQGVIERRTGFPADPGYRVEVQRFVTRSGWPGLLEDGGPVAACERRYCLEKGQTLTVKFIAEVKLEAGRLARLAAKPRDALSAPCGRVAVREYNQANGEAGSRAEVQPSSEITAPVEEPDRAHRSSTAVRRSSGPGLHILIQPPSFGRCVPK